jgi:hypothetical protein
LNQERVREREREKRAERENNKPLESHNMPIFAQQTPLPSGKNEKESREQVLRYDARTKKTRTYL